jgi:hypothetical protein
MSAGTVLDFAEVDQTTRAVRLEFSNTRATERTLNLEKQVDRRLSESQTLSDVALVLYQLLTGGYSVSLHGSIYYARALVAVAGGLRVELRIGEHAPPYFRVTADQVDASFAIDDCAHIEGELPPGAQQMIVRWHRGARPLLVRQWNAARPNTAEPTGGGAAS